MTTENMKPKRSLNILTLFSIFLSSFLTDAKITSNQLNDDGLTHIDLSRSRSSKGSFGQTADHLSRRRRAAAGSSPHSDKLEVHTTLLSDPTHNEAIVHWTGSNSSVMFILSRHKQPNGSVPNSKLWRSKDFGRSFQSASSVSNLPDDAVVTYYLAAPMNKKNLIFVDKKNHKVYTTTDEGLTFATSVGCGSSADKLIFHPSKDSHVLCYCESERKLYLSPDFAKSWDLVESYVNPRFFWAVPDQENQDTIHMEVLDPASGHFYYKAVTHPYPTDVTIDKDLGPIEVDSLLVINEYIFVQKTSQYASWLHVSWKRQSFKLAYFPRNRHPEDLNVIDADESQVFVAGSQPSSNFFYTISTLYLSDPTGQFYIMSLDTVTDVGLREIQGLRGVYVVNQKQGMGSHSGLVSSITFDQGGKWSRIPAPPKDATGKATNCVLADGCSLHLTHIVSEKNAPGTIMGMGNCGKVLTGFDNITLLMSTDGGVSWKFILSSNSQYQANILDQGGAVVAVPQTLTQSNKENFIHYSHDEGDTWQTYTYSNDTMRVDAVLNDPGIETRTVVIFGHDEDAKKPGWLVIMVDFSKILTRPCSDADYHDWHPTDQNPDNQCLLGQKLTFKRRKSSAECFNGKDYEHSASNKTCPCTEEDYECDYGYQEANKKCVAASWFDASRPVGDCPEGGTYIQSQGYRKVASDKCSPELHVPVLKKKNCPIMVPDGLHITLVGRRVIPIRQPVELYLVQERGSKTSTNYTWNYGDSTSSITYQGYEKSKNQTHLYKTRGLYKVTVTAANRDGSRTISLDVLVEDSIKGLEVETPHGAIVNSPVLFEVTVSDDFDPFYIPKPGVHYMWKFGDESYGENAQLTWKTTITHKYKTAKNYSVFVEAMNGGDSVFQIVQVPVYGTLKTVQLVFNSVLDNINDGTVMWQDMFTRRLRESLSKHLAVDPFRLEVVILKLTSRTVADVSVLPHSQEMTSDPSIDKIVEKMKSLPTKLKISLNRDEFGNDYEIRVTGVEVLQQDSDGSGDNNYLAVYICVPILVAAIFVSLLIVLYYKKTFSSQARRYRLLHGQQGDGPEPDSLLDDTDDDDPPLDLNIGDSNQRLALSDDDNNRGLLSSDRRNLDV